MAFMCNNEMQFCSLKIQKTEGTVSSEELMDQGKNKGRAFLMTAGLLVPSVSRAYQITSIGFEECNPSTVVNDKNLQKCSLGTEYLAECDCFIKKKKSYFQNLFKVV